MLSKYELGRGLAAEEEFGLDFHGEPEGEDSFLRQEEIVHQIMISGGWDSDVDRGYNEARRSYAEERHS